MKKSCRYIVVITVLMLALSIFSGCKNNQSAYAIKASFTHKSLSARVGDIITPDNNTFFVSPTSIEVISVFSSSNPNVAKVNAITGEIECIKEGEATIYGRVKKPDGEFVGDSFTLKVLEELVFATDFSLNTDNIIVGILEKDKTNAITFEGENVNVMPTISYENATIASYDYKTGVITPINCGTTKVYVTLELQDVTTTKTFTITVVDKIKYIDAESTYTVPKNEHFYIYFEIKDNTFSGGVANNQDVYVETSVNGELIPIVEVEYKRVLVKAGSNSGEVLIKIISLQDASVFKYIKIIIE